MHHPTDRIAHTTAFATPVVEHWLERAADNDVTTHHLTSSGFIDRMPECLYPQPN